MVKPMQSAITGMFSKEGHGRDGQCACGRSVNQVMSGVPESRDFGVGVSILSYARGLQFGLITDAKMWARP